MIEVKKEQIGLFSATFIGVSAIIGSGWLFAPYVAAHISGGGAIFAWIIGALIVLVLGMCFSELAALHPVRGLSAVVASISHNKYFGFPFAIANWLGIIAVVALEADATVQYLVSLFPSMYSVFFTQHHLTWVGDSCSAVLVLFYSVLNFWGVKLLAKTNNVITLLKLFIPLLTIIVLLSLVFHPSNFESAKHEFLPYGFSSVIGTVLFAGIIVSFNGFQSVISFASEIKDPHKTIPQALALAVVICLVVYVLLQIAFIGALPTSLVEKGWHQLHMSAPMVQLTAMVGLGYFSIILYAGATIAPLGTAITFTGAASRMFTAMARQKQMPAFFDHVHPRYGISRRSLVMNTILALLFLFLFKSWSDLAQVLGVLHILSYITVPLAMMVFRQSTEKEKYKFYVPFGGAVCVVLFIIFNYLISFGDVIIVLELALMILLFQVIFLVSNARDDFAAIKEHARSILLLTSYIILLPALSYLQHQLSFVEFLPILLVFSLGYLHLMTKKAWYYR